MGVCGVKSCNKVAECNGHCMYSYGHALVRFLTGADAVETLIGDFRVSKSNGGEQMIVSGIQVEGDTSPSHIMSPLSVSLDIGNKFKTIDNKNVLQILNEYLDKHPGKYNENHIAAIKDRLKKIQTNRVIIVPIKPKMGCEIRLLDDGKIKTNETTIEFIKWCNNIQTGKFEGTAITYVGEYDGVMKRQKISLEDYGDALRLTQIERSIRCTKLDRKCIKMTRFGYIKPLVVVGGAKTLAIDGTYLYLIDGEKVTLIGYWDQDKIKECADLDSRGIKKLDAYTYIMDNLEYIEKHRRFIAPYGITESNTITL